MPTYNDYDSIYFSIKSIISQDYHDWELIIINDGSLDNTDEIVHSFRDSRIKYIKLNQNRGQLNALLEGKKYITGQYVTMLHSDDEFLSKKSLSSSMSMIKKNNLDGIYSDLQIINEKGDFCGIFKTVDHVSRKTLANVFLLRGANLLSDIFFVKRECFEKFVVSNYLSWNMPYWFHIDKEIYIANLKKVSPWYGYHLHNQNYILSDIGKFEVFNGMLRTTLTLSQFFNEYKLSRLPRISELLIRKYNLSFFSSSPYNGSLFDLIKSVYYGIYGEENPLNNQYLDVLFQFYLNYPNNCVLTIPQDLINDCKIWYLGSDSRKFYMDIGSNNIDPYYQFLLSNARNGFTIVKIKDSDKASKVVDSLKFLNFRSTVIIEK